MNATTPENWRWQRKQPTAYGWYWFRESDNHNECIVQIFKDDDSFDSVRFGSGADDTTFLDSCVGEWCGPIPEPAKP